MALLPNRDVLDGTKVPATTTSDMKTALGSLRDYLAGLLGTDSTDLAAARAALGTTTEAQGLADAAAALVAVKPGTIIDFGGVVPPSGYLACPLVATNISRTTYAALFAAIETAWGSGDGSTTFGMPYFAAGFAAVQATGGNSGATTAGLIQAHTHPITTPNGAASVGGLVAGHSSNTGTIQSVTGNNLAAGMRVLKCIKY